MEQLVDYTPTTKTRKDDHIRINLEEKVTFNQRTSGFERYCFTHNALPELNLSDIDSTQFFFGKQMQLPLLISSMTGGTAVAERFNQIFAEAAQATGVAMGLGSQRAAIEDKTLASTYQVRSIAPDILLFANLGAVQLNYGYGLDECLRAVDMVEADALILHFNPLQEAVQPEGDTNFSGLLAKVEAICRALPVPIIAKEVGWGFSGTCPSAPVAGRLGRARTSRMKIMALTTCAAIHQVHQTGSERAMASMNAIEPHKPNPTNNNGSQCQRRPA